MERHLKKIISIRRFFCFAGLVLIFGISLTGCGTSGTIGSLKVQPNNQVSTRIIFNNSFLASKIKIDDLRPSFAGDLLIAHVSVTSTHNSALDVQYKFRWYDVQGFEVAPDGAPWQPLTLFGGESKGLQATAPNPTVKEFKIEIRYTK